MTSPVLAAPILKMERLAQPLTKNCEPGHSALASMYFALLVAFKVTIGVHKTDMIYGTNR